MLCLSAAVQELHNKTYDLSPPFDSADGNVSALWLECSVEDATERCRLRFLKTITASGLPQGDTYTVARFPHFSSSLLCLTFPCASARSRQGFACNRPAAAHGAQMSN